eukprot:3450998-Prymnesium_polylepis.2
MTAEDATCLRHVAVPPDDAWPSHTRTLARRYSRNRPFPDFGNATPGGRESIDPRIDELIQKSSPSNLVTQ